MGSRASRMVSLVLVPAWCLVATPAAGFRISDDDEAVLNLQGATVAAGPLDDRYLVAWQRTSPVNPAYCFVRAAFVQAGVPHVEGEGTPMVRRTDLGLMVPTGNGPLAVAHDGRRFVVVVASASRIAALPITDTGVPQMSAPHGVAGRLQARVAVDCDASSHRCLALWEAGSGMLQWSWLDDAGTWSANGSGAPGATWPAARFVSGHYLVAWAEAGGVGMGTITSGSLSLSTRAPAPATMPASPAIACSPTECLLAFVAGPAGGRTLRTIALRHDGSPLTPDAPAMAEPGVDVQAASLTYDGISYRAAVTYLHAGQSSLRATGIRVTRGTPPAISIVLPHRDLAVMPAMAQAATIATLGSGQSLVAAAYSPDSETPGYRIEGWHFGEVPDAGGDAGTDAGSDTAPADTGATTDTGVVAPPADAGSPVDAGRPAPSWAFQGAGGCSAAGVPASGRTAWLLLLAGGVAAARRRRR